MVQAGIVFAEGQPQRLPQLPRAVEQVGIDDGVVNRDQPRTLTGHQLARDRRPDAGSSRRAWARRCAGKSAGVMDSTSIRSRSGPTSSSRALNRDRRRPRSSTAARPDSWTERSRHCDDVVGGEHVGSGGPRRRRVERVEDTTGVAVVCAAERGEVGTQLGDPTAWSAASYCNDGVRWIRPVLNIGSCS